MFEQYRDEFKVVNEGTDEEWWRRKVTKAVEDVDDIEFIKKVIETIWVMREEEGINAPEKIERDFSDDELHDDPRPETDEEKYGYPGDRGGGIFPGM